VSRGRRLPAALCVAACMLLVSTVAAAPAPAPEPARRIVTLAPHLAELVHAAGAGDRLVGVSEWSDYPPGVEQLPRVDNAFQVDQERLAALAPDLVLGWRGGNPDRMLAQLEQRGYRVVALETATLDDVALQLEAIGRLAGTSDIAAQAARRYREALAALRAEQAGKAELRVFYQVSWQPLYTIGGRQLISRVIALCGGRNVFADVETLAPAVGLEAVVARDPQVILGGGSQADQFDGWQRWGTVSAVAGGHMYAVDGNLVTRPAPRILAGARQVCAALDRARAAPE
jgi:iron complex transport system substrate-binding protein